MGQPNCRLERRCCNGSLTCWPFSGRSWSSPGWEVNTTRPLCTRWNMVILWMPLQGASMYKERTWRVLGPLYRWVLLAESDLTTGLHRRLCCAALIGYTFDMIPMVQNLSPGHQTNACVSERNVTFFLRFSCDTIIQMTRWSKASRFVWRIVWVMGLPSPLRNYYPINYTIYPSVVVTDVGHGIQDWGTNVRGFRSSRCLDGPHVERNNTVQTKWRMQLMLTIVCTL